VPNTNHEPRSTNHDLPITNHKSRVTESLLSVRGLSKSFGGVHAVQDVSFELGRGQLLALIGPNGAGKSTCFNMLNGQLRPDAGSVVLEGVDIAGRPPREVWQRGVGRTFQITATYGSMTVRENVQMVLLSRARRLFSVWPRASDLYRDEAMNLLSRVGMGDQSERPCGLLAYGDVKRVELAMALAHAPKLLLMDEPTAGMAPKERNDLMALTAELTRERNLGVLFTEHSMDVVFTYAQQLLVLSRGLVIAKGSPAEVRDNEEVQRIYLGTGATFRPRVV
jgi:branched-chain amino acid transport system ATP-binding protein